MILSVAFHPPSHLLHMGRKMVHSLIQKRDGVMKSPLLISGPVFARKNSQFLSRSNRQGNDILLGEDRMRGNIYRMKK